MTSPAPRRRCQARRRGERARPQQGSGVDAWTVFHLPSTPDVFLTVGLGGYGHHRFDMGTRQRSWAKWRPSFLSPSFSLWRPARGFCSRSCSWIESCSHIEVDLKVRGATESDDEDLSFLVASVFFFMILVYVFTPA
jgi:hypothetical protein